MLSFILLLLGLTIFEYYHDKNNKIINNKISVAEVTHSVFYAPLYVSIENGYFKKNNIEIDLTMIAGADKVSSAVLSGDVQIGFAGAESALYVYEKNKNGDYLKIFSGLTKRDGQFIISKTNETNFNLKSLYGKEILVGRKTGMPALNFLNALKKEGINESKININYSIDFSSLTGAFVGGTGDYVNLFEPNALKLEKERKGYVVSSIGKLSGEMPYTVFYAKNSFVENNEKLINNFRKAIDQGLTFVKNHNSNDIAKVIHNQFSDMELEQLSIIIQRYKDNDSWLDSYYINNEYLNNLENLLKDYNLIKDKISYDEIIKK